jgi:AraC family transcriptional regulator
MEVRDEGSCRAEAAVQYMPVSFPQRPIDLSCPNSSISSTVPASVRIGQLVLRALTLFESNREVAWTCLRYASTLLGREFEAISILRAGDLAAWQTKYALEYIERNLGSKITTRQIANCAALSKSHFSRAFRRSLGCSPMAYVTLRRVERAKMMMASTHETLATIALACGFSDQSHFCRCFRRTVGTSPALWRRALTSYSA